MLAEEQKQVIEAHTKDLIAQGIVANQRRSESQVKEIVSAVRRKHYVEVGLYAIAAALMLTSISWMAAWVTVEGNSDWGDIERWNKDHLQACVEAQMTTCNFHIEVPHRER